MVCPSARLSRLSCVLLSLTVAGFLYPGEAHAWPFFRGFGGATNGNCAAASSTTAKPEKEFIAGGVFGASSEYFGFHIGGIGSLCKNQNKSLVLGADFFPIHLGDGKVSIGAGVNSDGEMTPGSEDGQTWTRLEGIFQLHLANLGTRKSRPDDPDDTNTYYDGALFLDLRVGRFQSRTTYLTLGLNMGLNPF
jgi:hypothetical protein